MATEQRKNLVAAAYERKIEMIRSELNAEIDRLQKLLDEDKEILRSAYLHLEPMRHKNGPATTRKRITERLTKR